MFAFCSSYNHSNVLPPVIIAQTLPDPDSFKQDVYQLAWPQILAYSSALIGIVLVLMIVKAFIK